ncbi:hypothetical protein [Streptomyces sp. ML-6]|uniref:hypothetical protein n=1 Tax=Streptomyces sp. ML-6 TaxID=2982693 RepID=UPI0024C00D75|nr:hypothetical protein [Streptomyces sp. ML-6]MDK0525002.1 hypothetical protein [Streptomyces sp. ML-6]
MSTPAPARQDRETQTELLALITVSTQRLTRDWGRLITAQDVLLRTLERIRPGIGATTRSRAAMNEFNRQVAMFDRDARAFAERWAAIDLPAVYRNGALQALRRANEAIDLFQWSIDHQAAIAPLTATFYVDLIRRIQEAVRRAQAFARAAQDATRDVVLGRNHTGINSKELSDAYPLATIVYADESRHPVAAWAHAALSWQGVATANRGAINTARWELEAEWMQCVDGPECGFVSHQDTDHADGTIRSIDEASMYPAAHHGCIRSWIPRPDLNGRTDIESGDPA